MGNQIDRIQDEHDCTRSRRTPPGRRPVLAHISLLMAATAIGFLALACDDDTPLPAADSTETKSAVSPAAPDSNTYELKITDDGFAPDNVEVPEGAVVRLSNESESGRIVMVSDLIEGDGEKIEPGEMLEITLPRLGAYVITSPGDTEFTASIMVLAPSEGR